MTRVRMYFYYTRSSADENDREGNMVSSDRSVSTAREGKEAGVLA